LPLGVTVAGAVSIFREPCRRSSTVIAGNAGGARVTHQTGTGKYEQLLVMCKNMKPIPTAVAHPWKESALSAAVFASGKPHSIAKDGVVVAHPGSGASLSVP
jgi:hypothetical protein